MASNDIFTSEVAAQTTELLQQMRADTPQVNWIAFGYKEGEETLTVLGSGDGSISAFEPLLVDDQVVYVLFGFSTEEEAYGRLVKRVLITFVGSRVKPLHKARSSQHRVQLYAFCGKQLQLAGEFHPENKAEVTEKAIAQKLSGSRHAEGMSTAGATAAAASGSPVPTGRARSATTKFAFADEAKSVELIKAVRNDTDPLNWVAWTYAADVELLHISSSGSGAYNEFSALLSDDVVLFGLLALKVRLDDAANHSQATTKYILVTWVGPKVTGRPKARSATDRVALYDFCTKHLQLGAEWQALSRDEISEEMLVAKLSGSILQVDKQVQEKTVKATVSDGISRANWDYQPQQYAGTAKPDLEDEAAALDVVQKIRDRALSFAVFGYKADGKSISLLASGVGGYNDVSSHFDDKAAVFVVLGLVFGAAEYGGLMKYPYICWIGPKVKPTVKARASQHRVLLYNWIFKTLPLAGEVQALTAEEISEDIIRKKMVGTTQLAEQETSAAQAGAVVAKTGGSGVERFDFVDQAAVEKAFREVRDDTKETNWCLIEYESELTGRLRLASAGHGGLESIKTYLADDKIVYVVLGFIQDEGDYSQVKYIFVTWVGDNTKPTHKGRSSQHRVKLYALAKQHLQLAGEIQILSADELNERSLAQKLSGSRMVTDTDAKTAQRETKLTKGSMEKFKIDDEAALQDLLTQMRKDNNPVDWVVLGYPEEAGKGDVVRIVASGQGSLAEVQKHFPTDRARYAIIAYKVVEVVDDVDYTRAKNVFLSWIGKDVKPLQRAKSSQHRVPIYEYANRSIQLHGQIHAEKEEDLSEDAIMEKLTGSRTQSQSRIQAEADRLKRLEQEKELARSRSKSTAVGDVTEIKTMLGDRVEALNSSLQVLAKRDTTHWLALGYSDADDSGVHVLGQGVGGLSECHPLFKDDQVVYAFIGIHEDGQAEGYNTLKYILVTSVGPECKPLHKARSSQHRVALYAHASKYLQLAGEMQALSASEITLEALRNKLTGAGKA